METEVMTTDESHDSEKPVFLGMKLTGTIRNGVFAGSVTHKYHNPRQRNIEAIMTMYAPLGAVVSKLSVKFGKSGEKVAKVVKDIEAAERYEDLVDSGDSAVLLEHSGDLRDVFTLNAGNLLPDEKMKATLRFSLELGVEDGRLRLTVPTTEIQKYGDPANLGRKDHQAPRMSHFVENPLEVCVKIADRDFKGKISSPNRKIHQERAADKNGDPVIEVSVDGRSFMDGDFILEVEPEKLDRQSYALSDVKEGIHYVMARHFVGQAKSRQRHASVKVLIDNSGSMSGGDIVLARDFMQTFSTRLGGSDSCTLSMFGNHVEHFSEHPVYADHAGKRLMSSFANTQRAHMGGTNIDMAVASVASLGHGEGTRNMLIITDGGFNVPDEVIRVAHGHRCFIVGVGSAAHHVLKPIAAATGGKYFEFHSGDNIDLVAKSVIESIQVEKATGIKVSWPGKPIWSIEPAAIWGNQSVDCFAAFETKPEGEMGIRYTQEGQGFQYKLNLPATDSLKGIATLAQGRYIEHLEETGESEKAEKLSIECQLMGRGTSLILEHIRDDSEKPAELPDQVHPEQMTPKGSFGTPHHGDESPRDAYQAFHKDLGDIAPDFARPNADPGFSITGERRNRRRNIEELDESIRFQSRTHHRHADEGNRQLRISRGVDKSGDEMLSMSSHGILRQSPPVKRKLTAVSPADALQLPHRYSLFIDDILVANQPLRPMLLAELLLLQTPELYDSPPRRGSNGTLTSLRMYKPDKQLVHLDHGGNKVKELNWEKFDSVHILDRRIKEMIIELRRLLRTSLGEHPIINKLLLLELNSFASLSERFKMTEDLTIDEAVRLLAKEINAQFRVINKDAFLFIAERLRITGEIKMFTKINSKRNGTCLKEMYCGQHTQGRS